MDEQGGNLVINTSGKCATTELSNQKRMDHHGDRQNDGRTVRHLCHNKLKTIKTHAGGLE